MSARIFRFRDIELQLFEIDKESTKKFRYLDGVFGSSIEMCIKSALFAGEEQIHSAKYFTARQVADQYCVSPGRQVWRVEFYNDEEEKYEHS